MTTDMSAKVGRWTPDSISQFWDYYGKQPGSQEQCFSKQVGKGLVDFLIYAGRLRSRISVLDFGCGPGFLIQHLLDQQVVCYGVDSSSELVSLVNQRFGGHQRWMGATRAFSPPLPYSDASFDLVTCVEVLEHLLDDDLRSIVLEIYRLLKPGGVALFTTPNNESLLLNQVFCPFCQTEFHKRQHIRSFNADSMRSLLEPVGFEVLFCEGMSFSLLQCQPLAPGWKDWSLRSMSQWVRFQKNIFLDRILHRPFPNGRVFRARAGLGAGAPHMCTLVERPKP